MSELKELFNEIKSIFKTEGVDIENDSKEFAETTENNVEETTETVKENLRMLYWLTVLLLRLNLKWL